jgi:guanylate kinase
MELDDRLKQKVAAYNPSARVLEPIRTAPLLFTVGITAAGKNALLHRLLETRPGDYSFLISHTSRAPRANHGVMERDGVEYHFVDLETMDRMLDNHEFIEAQVIHNAWVSGSSIAEVKKAQEQNRISVTDIDVQGIDVYVNLGLNVKPVFILPPSYDVWMERLIRRYEGRTHQHDLVLRMQSAVREIEHALSVDHFYIVINDALDEAVEVVDDIAHGKPVDPHYHKAVAVAQQLLARIKEELARVV